MGNMDNSNEEDNKNELGKPTFAPKSSIVKMVRLH